MSAIGSTTQLPQISAAELGQKIAFRVARMTMDAAREKGDAILELLEGAVEMAENTPDTPESAVTGLGLRLDIRV